MIKLAKEKFVRIEVFLLILLISIVPIGFVLSDTLDQGFELKADNEGYELLVEVTQWTYRVYDLNKIDVDFNQIDDLQVEQLIEFQMDNPRLHVDANLNMTIHMKSRDVDHGILFEEVDFQLLIERPSPDEEFGPVSSGSFILPDSDQVIEGKSPIPVGLGTDSMVIKLIIGNPYLLTNIFLTSVIALLVSVFVYYSYRIITMRDEAF